jgi:hypothetical protein
MALSLVFQLGNTLAWNDNQDFLDTDFWNNDWNGTNPMLIQSLYGDGNIGLDTTAYTAGWNTNVCSTNTMTVQLVSPGIDSIPTDMSVANTIYVLAPGTYTSTQTKTINNDCIAIV